MTYPNHSASVIQHATITASELKTIVEHQIHTAKENENGAQYLSPLMVWGPPGVGKSTIIREACAAQNIGFIDIRLSQREPVDLRGLPVPKNDHVDWLLAGEWPRDPQSRGIILFDEITAADRALQVAAYEIILDRRLGDLYQLPKGWIVAAAGNRSTDQAVAHAFSSALANRFCHLELEADVDSWCYWAQQRNLAHEVIAFVRHQPNTFFNMKGDLQRGWPSPRSWERVSHLLQQQKTQPLPESLLHILIAGLIGSAAGIEFQAFLRAQAKLPDVSAMLANKVPIEIPEEPDLRFAFCSALVHYLWRGNVNQARLQRFIEIMLAMSSDFATMTLIDAITHDNQEQANQRMELILAHDGFEAWSDRHGVALAAKGGLNGK
jgi:hypothetical protein